MTPTRKSEVVELAPNPPAEKMQPAILSATVLGSRGGWISDPKRAHMVIERAKPAMLDAQKLERMREILRPLNLDAGQERALIDDALFAACDLYFIKSSRRGRPATLEKVERLAKAASLFCEAFDDLGEDLREELSSPIGWRKHVLDSDAAQNIEGVAACATEIIDALRADHSHDPAPHLCAQVIAFSWWELTGMRPTISRNKDASLSGQRSYFQRFIAEAIAPLIIGDGVIRSAVQSLMIGDKFR